MSVIYSQKISSSKRKKLNYFTPKVWRLTYLISLNSVYHNSEKKIYTRSSTIPTGFTSYEVTIHNGTKWSTKRINRWMVGYKFGEFTWNRKYALYKAKSKKKKKK